MTNTNYEKAISLLQERYGQTHKIVQTYMQALLDLQAPINTITSLRNYYDKTETYVRGLESLGQTDDTYGSLLVPVILNKLPAEIRQHLAREHRSTNWTLHDLRKALLEELNIMEAGKLPEKVESPLATATFLTNAKSRTKSSFNKNERSYSDKKINTKQCAFCHEIGHTPVNCTKVTTANARMNIVKSERLCFNCLGHHKLADCKSKSNCRNCNKRHHTSICSNDEKSEESSKPPANETENTVLHSSLTQRTTNVLLKTAVATVSSKKQSTEANILLDEGAQRSFITETLAEKLDLVSSGNEVVHLSGFGEQNRQVRHLKSATVYIQTDEGENIPLNVLIIPEIAMPLQIHVRSVTNMRHLRGLKLAHPVSDDDMFEIEILIGADYYWSIVGDDIIRGEGPTAVESRLGYLLSGPTMTSTCTTSRSSILNVIVSHKTEELNLEKFWEIESIGVEDKTGNTENDEFQKMYEETAISFNNNRYIAKLPWKAEHPPLPTNKAVAFRRTESVIKRLQKEPKLLLKYGEIIDEQEKRGFIERVDNEEINQNIKLHYIPHHPVKKDSVTTPIRIVYDCSCKQTPDSASLNDCLLNVPPKLNEVTAILLRFRLNKYAVSTDIEKAFLNVGLDIEDRDVTRFFWLSKPTDPNSDLTTYRFKSVLFGATCSPFILNAVLSKHLNNHPVDFTDKLTKDLYVDNIVSSFESEEELLKYFKLVRSLFADGGFNLRSWASNSQLLQVLARTENVMDKDQLVKILGLRWDTASDTLGFVTPNLDTSELITKREVLRQSSRIYDPLGILSPITVRSKMLMQNIWEKNFNWDELLPDSTITEWVNIRKDIQEATKTVVPRHYFDESPDTNNDNVIHVFTDSSMKAYGACAYIVANGKSSLIMAKNRVAPLKQLTIPRLELMAAVIGSRLLAHIRNTLQITRAVLWSDSQIVLTWLSSKKPLKPFISNHVKEITELTEELTWRYCPSESNPADLLSRGITVDKFKDNRLWMHGPDWLTLEDNWPEWNRDEAQILSTIAHQEVAVDTVQATQNKFTIHMIQGIGNVIDLNRFNSFKKLLRITAYVRRFITNCRKRAIHTGMLNTIEIQNASLTWIQYIQKKHYSEIIQDLQTGEGKKHNLVKQLKLYIAQDKLIRCDGRIHNAPLEENTKFPILLPAKDKLTQLIIMDAHVTHFHSGLSSTVTLLRQTYWIPSIRQVIKSIIHKCVICKKVAGRPYSAPDPPPLPKDRLTEAPPFTVTGVDFTGALNVKTTDGLTSKVYVCLFTCANTRAVHLEVVMNLSEETFILAFRRFASRKSLPKTMISDNGTTFIAAAKQLTRSSAVIEKLNNFGTTWKFIPKRAPWYGGFWERLIGLTKDSIKKVLGRSLIQIELLRTIVTEVEAILNDRPLTYVSSDPLDEPLTPSHLLYGRRITSLPYPTNQELEHSLNDMTHKSTNKLFKMKSQIIQSFWYKWKHEYLTALREYHRNTGNNKQLITIGDVVQIYEDSPRIKWTLAVVEKLNVGGDGLARSAVIRTKNGLTSRPITKLYPLEVSLNSDDDNTDCAIKTCRKAKMVAMEKIKKWTK